MDKIPCLSTFKHEVYAVDLSIPISYSDLLSCTKMYNIYGISYSMLLEENYVLTMSWSNPTCGSSETECYKAQASRQEGITKNPTNTLHHRPKGKVFAMKEIKSVDQCFYHYY